MAPCVAYKPVELAQRQLLYQDPPRKCWEQFFSPRILVLLKVVNFMELWVDKLEVERINHFSYVFSDFDKEGIAGLWI